MSDELVRALSAEYSAIVRTAMRSNLDDGWSAQQVNVEKFQCDILYTTCLLNSHL